MFDESRKISYITWGNINKGDGLVHQRDVFVHQLRAELNRFGLNIGSDPYTQLVKKVEAIQHTETASTVFLRFNAYELTFSENDVVNAENFIQQCNYTCDWSDMTIKGENVVRNKHPFSFKIKMQLTEDENSIFIDSFNYYIHLSKENIEWYAIAKASWSEDID